MTESALESLKYPIGQFVKPNCIDASLIEQWISDIEDLPSSIMTLVNGLTVEERHFSYRPDGWTIKQVVHHCADSHMNAFIRFKLALTEESPTIRPYYEDRWANLIDGNDDDLIDTLFVLKGLHSKFGKLLRNISQEDLSRDYIHPEHGQRFRLDHAIGMYAWHGNHHLAHILQALEYKGSF
ncbi:MAG: YfiT family bacillithiol transferase [Aquaticitalea sp.]